MLEQLILDSLAELGQPERLLNLKARLDARLADFEFAASTMHLFHGTPLRPRSSVATKVRKEEEELRSLEPGSVKLEAVTERCM